MHTFKYRKQQKLSERKLLLFSEIFDESQKFSLLIDRRHTVDIIMEAKLRRFSQYFHKSYQTAKLFHLLYKHLLESGFSYYWALEVIQKEYMGMQSSI